MSEIFEFLKPIIWIFVAFGVLITSSMLALVVAVIIKAIKGIKDNEEDMK
jgi:hypothetical protein